MNSLIALLSLVSLGPLVPACLALGYSSVSRNTYCAMTAKQILGDIGTCC